MGNFMKLFFRIVTITTLTAWAVTTYAEYGLNFPEPVTSSARDIYDIHMNTIAIITIMMIIVYGIVGVSIYFHRKSRGYSADQEFHKGWFGRWSWVLVPIIVLGIDLSIAGNAERVLKDLWLIPKDEKMMDIKVIGHQWWWEYEYIDHGVSVESRFVPKEEAGDLYLREVDNNLVLPTNTKIRFLHTSADVMHAFWVPELGMKKDAVAGYITETWAEIDTEGVYRGQCAELCGTWHARMPIVVEAVSTEKFDEWVVGQKQVMLAKAEEAASDKEWSMDELMEKGRGVYNKHCAACHQLGGEGLPPTFPPIKGSAIVKGPLAEHMDVVLNGKVGAGMPMPPWADLLNNLELAAVITYERNAWENNTGDIVQPSDVQVAR
jgi:cytochrome c oxidase subunit II